MWDHALTAFTTLFVTIDPPGLAPIFLALTAGMNTAQRRQVGQRGTAIAFVVLVIFALTGATLLSLFGITMAAFRIAGGLLLFAIAFEMIFEKRQERHEKSAERVITSDDVRHIAVFPLAIPLTAGPGAISAVILISGEESSIQHRAVLIALIAAILAITLLVFTAAERIERFLGETGRIVLTRLLGVILAALAVQFVGDGVLAFIRLQSGA